MSYDSKAISQYAVDTIQNEIAALQKMSGFVNEDFIRSVILMHEARGRVVITGIGKSAIIAQKIVADDELYRYPRAVHACCRRDTWRPGHDPAR